MLVSSKFHVKRSTLFVFCFSRRDRVAMMDMSLRTRFYFLVIFENPVLLDTPQMAVVRLALSGTCRRFPLQDPQHNTFLTMVRLSLMVSRIPGFVNAAAILVTFQLSASTV